MVRIADGQDIPQDIGGRLSLSSFIRQPQAEPPKENVLSSLERLLSNPAMQPVVQQGARLIAAYADKITLDNNERVQKMQAAQQPAGPKPHQVLFGAGAPQP